MSELIFETTEEIAMCEDADVLMSGLKQCAVNILGNLERMAAILRRLDELGVQITLDHALIPYIRMIANGQLSASCFVACAADPELLNKAVKLPLSAQEKIGKDEPFPLVDPSGERREVRPSEMTRRDLNQAFGENFVRSDEGQKKWLATSANKSAAQKTDWSKRSMTQVAGQLVEGSTRCTSCGCRLIPGAECLKCKLDDPDEVGEMEAAEDEYELYSTHGKNSSQSQVADDSGWQERLAILRAAKQSGDELGFHVDWLMRFCERELNDEHAEKLEPLHRLLSQKIANWVTV